MTALTLGHTGAEVLTQRATALYRAKQYAQACPLFAQVTHQLPSSAPAWNDLALCELRRGQNDRAFTALARVLALGDLAERKKAYFNLALLAPSLQAGDDETGCREVRPVPGCKQRLWRCNHNAWGGGSTSAYQSEVVSFGTTLEAAQVAEPSLQLVDVAFDWIPPRDEASADPHACLEAGTDRTRQLLWVDPCGGRLAMMCRTRDVCDNSAVPKDGVHQSIEEQPFPSP
jgi:tetratricopeptide (TPR) repeat protein